MEKDQTYLQELSRHGCFTTSLRTKSKKLDLTTIKYILNKRDISFRNNIYKGKLYLRDVRKINEMYDVYCNYINN